ncbi:acetyltransferase [Lysobacteraceae bacterium NML120232]|nr:acetyltransferase [Xanthomonadaceae bacterium NML08-0793]PJK12432.1 acetyltransferase [Xanthomonadaceae bacterium NML120232]
MEVSKPTAVFVDGYNLYYGRIRGTPYKWLDLLKLFDALLNEQDPSARLAKLNYFTAPALGRFATHGKASPNAQNDYHRALATTHPERFSLILGKHSFDRNGTLLPRFVENTPYDRNNRVRVWKLEEKQTDVNLALSMYRAASSGKFRQLVVCSNDSDVAPALEALRQDFPDLTLGVVMPRRPPATSVANHRAASASLDKYSHWTRRHLFDNELGRAQFPDIIPTSKKPIRKPAHW